MSLEQYKAWQREYSELKKRVVSLELELQAANDKLEVYRRTEPKGVSDILFGKMETNTSKFGTGPCVYACINVRYYSMHLL